MNNNIAFLELKYGNIYGGPPNFYVISEASLLVYEPRTRRIFLESTPNNVDVDIVNVYSKIDDLGNTTERVREVVNLRSMRKNKYDPEFRLDERPLGDLYYRVGGTKRYLSNFFNKNIRKYDIRDLVTFDGKRDIFLCEKMGVDFRRIHINDIQKDITQETNYLFSLNKLSVITNYRFDGSYVSSNNLDYRLHPIAAKQIRPKTAAEDAVRLLVVHEEFMQHREDFMMKAALLLNKIERAKTT